MRFKISLSDEGTYLRIKTLDAITGLIEKEFAENAIKDSRQHKTNRFLVDVQGTPNIASTSEQYLFGYEDVKKFGLKKDSRIAILVDENDKSHYFIETVLLNAGYSCRIFSNETKAVNWLLE